MSRKKRKLDHTGASVVATPSNSLDDVKSFNDLNKIEQFILTALQHDPSDNQGKGRRRGRRRGRPASEEDKIVTKSDQWIKNTNHEERMDIFRKYLDTWFQDVSDYFKPWPMDVIDGSINALQIQENSVYYLWILTNKKDKKNVSPVAITQKKITEKFEIKTTGTILLVSRFKGNQSEHSERMLEECKRAKTLRNKLIVATQYAMKYGIETKIDAQVVTKPSEFYMKEVVALLMDYREKHMTQHPHITSATPSPPSS
jgi:hypothetical protein